MFAQGTTLSRAGNVIAKLKKIASPAAKMDKLDATTHQSAGGYKEFEGGLIDPGDLAIEGLLDSTDTLGQVALLTDMNNRTLQTFVITFPSGTTWTFNALVTEYSTDEAAQDGQLMFKATLAISGKPTMGITVSAGLTTPFMALSGGGTLIPTAAQAVTDYVYSVVTGTTSITVTPTAAAGTITVNGNTVASGAASSAITLGAAGSVTAIPVIITETGKSPKTYTIRVARA